MSKLDVRTNEMLTLLSRPTAILQARIRRVCPVCTIQEDRPVMLEEGTEWDLHQRTRSHRRLAVKLTQKDYLQHKHCDTKQDIYGDE